MRYPTVFAYLARLPQGVLSYPAMQTNADLFLAVQKKYPDLGQQADLPEDVRATMKQPVHAGSWVSEVQFMLQNALVRDVIYRNDTGYLQFCYDTMKDAYSGVALRAMMYFASPKLVCIGVEKRWSQHKRGTLLKTLGGGKTDHQFSLKYPANAYVKCMLEGFAKSIEAAFDCTQAKNGRVEVKIISTEECHFLLSWNGSD